MHAKFCDITACIYANWHTHIFIIHPLRACVFQFLLHSCIVIFWHYYSHMCMHSCIHVYKYIHSFKDTCLNPPQAPPLGTQETFGLLDMKTLSKHQSSYMATDDHNMLPRFTNITDWGKSPLGQERVSAVTLVVQLGVQLAVGLSGRITGWFSC